LLHIGLLGGGFLRHRLRVVGFGFRLGQAGFQRIDAFFILRPHAGNFGAQRLQSLSAAFAGGIAIPASTPQAASTDKDFGYIAISLNN